MRPCAARCSSGRLGSRRPMWSWPIRRSAPARFCSACCAALPTTVAKDQGAGAVRGAIEAAAKRIIGFEMQFGPFAVAQLRLIAELQALMSKPPLPELRLFITDTLGNPFIEEETARADI